MVVTCSFAKCGRSKKNDEDHGFFLVPKEPAVREKWVQFAGWTEIRSYYRLCEDHFDPQLIWKRYPRPLLVPNAIPTVERCIVKRREDKKQTRETCNESGNGKKLDGNASPTPLGRSRPSAKSQLISAENRVTDMVAAERITVLHSDNSFEVVILPGNDDSNTGVICEITPDSNSPHKQPKQIFASRTLQLNSQRRKITPLQSKANRLAQMRNNRLGNKERKLLRSKN